MSERLTEKVAGAAALGRETAPASGPRRASGRNVPTDNPQSARDLKARIEDAAWNEVELIMGAYHCEQTLVRGALPYLALEGREQCSVTAMHQIVDGDAKLASKGAHQRTGRIAPAMFPLPNSQVMRTAQPFGKLLLRKFTS